MLTRCVPFGKSHNLSGPQLCISPVCWGLTVCWAQGQVRLRAISCSPLCLCKEDMEAQRGWEPCPRTPSLGAWSGAGPELAPAPLSLTAPSPPPPPRPPAPQPAHPPPHVPSPPLVTDSVPPANDLHVSGIGFPLVWPCPSGDRGPPRSDAAGAGPPQQLRGSS